MSIRATYRLQFHAGFTFGDAARLAPYFSGLGISHIYASPIAEAKKGSAHGYDVVDPSAISSERGGAAGFLEMAEALRKFGLGIILDIVPNHMAACFENRWWRHVLENGRSSRYAKYFDIDWSSDDQRLGGKLLAPFLSVPLQEALRSGSIKLVIDEETQSPTLTHYAPRFPRPPEDARVLLAEPFTESRAAQCNRPEALEALLARQRYVLCWWREADTRINWRRFFDITALAAIRMEEDEVFEAVHALPFDLYERGLIDGVRVDHVDGLTDPECYCRRLRARFSTLRRKRSVQNAEDAFIVVEKVLNTKETVPPCWHVDGTTGYDFMHEVGAFLHAESGKNALDALWRRMAGDDATIDAIEVAARSMLATSIFASALEQCASAFLRCAGPDTDQEISRPLLLRTLVRLLAQLRVYRASPEQPALLEEALARATAGSAAAETIGLAFIARILSDTEPSAGAAEAARRFHQLSATLAAKAVEDTTFYRYGRLLSRNEVGSDPRVFSLSASEFHQRAQRRNEQFPRSLLATATHDHKRGEDTRARLAILSELPDAWGSAVSGWYAELADIRPQGVEDDTLYMLLQTVVAAWPLDLDASEPRALDAFRARISIWLTKALREAKRKTSWTDINESYEVAAQNLLRMILVPGPVADSIERFVTRISAAGAANGIVQAALRLTMPGAPDLYQGTEYWDFSLVDPDNRGAADFNLRCRSLEESFDAARVGWRRGALKQQLIRRLLQLRADHAPLFAGGDYRPVAASGQRAAHVFAFTRHDKGGCVLVVTARHTAEPLLDGDALTPPAEWWADTTCAPECSSRLRGCFSTKVQSGGELPIAQCLVDLPVEIFVSA